MHWPRGQKVKITRLWKPSRRTVAIGPYSAYPIRRCATCGCCRLESACRYDCLCSLVQHILTGLSYLYCSYRPTIIYCSSRLSFCFVKYIMMVFKEHQSALRLCRRVNYRVTRKTAPLAAESENNYARSFAE